MTPFLAGWLVLIALHLGKAVLAALHPRLPGKGRADGPRPVSVLLPVAGVDTAFEPALVSVYRQDHPRFEVVIAAESEDAPGYRAAAAIAARFAETPTRFVTARARIVHNPKINNLVPALAAAAHDTILVKDSNIVLAPDDLARLAGRLGPGIGLVAAIPIATEPENLAAEVECAFMNGHGAAYLSAAAAIGIETCMGKVMLFRKSDFERAGGVTAIGFSFGDDQALLRAMGRIGLSTVYTDKPVRQPLGARGWRQVWDRQLRWMVIRRDHEPAAFIAEPFGVPLWAAIVGGLAAPAIGQPWWALAAGTLALLLAAEAALLAARGWGPSWRYLLAALVRDAMIWTLWLAALGTRRVSWVGRSFALAPAGERPSAGHGRDDG